MNHLSIATNYAFDNSLKKKQQQLLISAFDNSHRERMRMTLGLWYCPIGLLNFGSLGLVPRIREM